MDEKINDILDKGIMRPTMSPWNSPIVLVRKKNNDIRFCVHYLSSGLSPSKGIFSS